MAALLPADGLGVEAAKIDKIVSVRKKSGFHWVLGQNSLLREADCIIRGAVFAPWVPSCCCFLVCAWEEREGIFNCSV